ncbi:MAG: tRNA dihydrouridine synthase DusB [Deltaproteobacteria bacterium]|nr:tRNA dihydrouridine synthase DusB [Deltaproteobacteria bacterium]
MKIGNVKLKNNLILAPMAGVTDLPFRLMATAEGCGLVVSEMVSARGLIMGGAKTRALLSIGDDEKPLSVQLFGAEPDSMAEAAAIVEESGADIIDINMGCPVKKVVGPGAGSALLKDLKKIEAIVGSVKKRITLPLTIKIRSGWDNSSIVVREVLNVAESAGVDAIALHPRTKAQAFGGKADWSLIGLLKEKASIPVIGNGDIRSPEDVRRMVDETRCDGVMIGRGAMGNPWIFRESALYLKNWHYDKPSFHEKKAKVLLHLSLVIEKYGTVRGLRLFRKHLAWYSRGIKGAAGFRRIINQSLSLEEVKDLIEKFFSCEGSSCTDADYSEEGPGMAMAS